MPVEPLFDISQIDLSGMVADRRALERYNPHRGEIAQLDGVIWHDDALDLGVAYKDVREDEFWVQGHIPGNPLLPGVLMVEAGAQLASFMYYKRSGSRNFAGFTRIDDTVFRGHVKPGDRLYLLVSCIKYHPKRFISAVQGVVNGEVVFEGKITGMSFAKFGQMRDEDEAGEDAGQSREQGQAQFPTPSHRSASG